MSEPSRVLILAPNWLGDAVMALPAIADVRRGFPRARIVAAAHGAAAGLLALAPAVDEVVALPRVGPWWRRGASAAAVARLREVGADLAILLPNSVGSAWRIRQAGIPERWGYRWGLRGGLLSRSVPRPRGRRHHGAYYQHLTRALGIASGPLEPVVAVPGSASAAARRLLVDRGWDGERPLAVFAPGAAYGTAKRWTPAYVGRVASDLVAGRQMTCAVVGSQGDAAAAALVLGAIDAAARGQVIDLTGETTIELLAGVLGLARVCVSNDSGAMHLAAAIGTPLVALFGPTREYETAPLPRAGSGAEVLTHRVWCRPCMLRECPIDHRCMTRITPERVHLALNRLMGA